MAFARSSAIVALVALVATASLADERQTITPFFWIVEQDDATLYLYGSIHAAPDEAIPPPRFVVDAFDRSDLLVTEVLLDDDVIAAAVFAVAERLILPAGTTLDRLIGRANTRRVEQRALRYGLPSEVVRTMQPWAIELVFAGAATSSADLSFANGLDKWFHDRAVAVGVPRGALETVDEQIDSLAGAPLDEQAQSLLRALDAESSGEVAALYDAWRSGDTEALARVMVDSLGQTPDAQATYDRLLIDRNRAWIPRLMEYLDAGGTTFVVVGAGHVVGPNNLIDLLEEAGLAATRLYADRDR